MLLGFSSCCLALKFMLCGFKICCPDLKMQSSILLFICACHHRICLYSYAQIGAIRGLHPSRLIGCWFKAKQLQRGGSSLWLHRAPGNWGNPGLSPWATGSEALPASSGPLGGTEALLESTFESQGDICWEEPTSQRPDQA